MGFLDYNWDEIVHSKSAEKIRGDALRYLQDNGVTRAVEMVSNLYAESMAAAVIYDSVCDPDPNPAKKELNLGKYFREKFGQTRRKYNFHDYPTSLDTMAWSAALFVYQKRKNQVMFTPDEIQAPFFLTVVGAAVTEAAGALAGAYAGKEGQAVGDSVKGVLNKIGDKFLDRLKDPFDAAQINDPNEWASRANVRKHNLFAVQEVIKIEKINLANALARGQLDAKMLDHEKNRFESKLKKEAIEDRILSLSKTLAKAKGLTKPKSKKTVVLASVGGFMLIGLLGWFLLSRPLRVR